MWSTVILSVVLVLVSAQDEQSACEDSITTVSGFKSMRSKICKGQVIFEDNFNDFNFETWEHENTLAGGGNWEFQWYNNNRTNSYVENGILNIHPSLTSDEFGEAFLKAGTLNIHGGAPADQCTNPKYWGCERVGNPTHVVNPVKSARIRTLHSFAFKYGKVEVRAKMPSGDWLWPAILLFPKRNDYGRWPASGEIDLVETRGNKELIQYGKNIGAKLMHSTLHYGPYSALNSPTTFVKYSDAGFDTAFHKYQMEWTPEKITFNLDDVEVGTVNVGTGFWDRGMFAQKAPGVASPWKYATKGAPFDQEFYLLINLAVGALDFFPDDAQNPKGKPWKNNSPQAATDFWNGKDQWLPTWKLNDPNSKEVNLQVDYIKVFAL